MSHACRSVICLHCQKVHNPGFVWNFSETVRVCFTCFREMGEEGRKSYEQRALKSGVAKTAGSAGSAMKIVGILALLLTVLGVSAYYFYQPLTEGAVEHRVAIRESRAPARR